MCRSIEWTPTNLLVGGETILRVGDALKLSAWPDREPISGSFTATLNGQNIATDQESGQPIVHAFTTPGTYTINVTYLAGEGQGEGARIWGKPF
jgi:hypothetical protein